MKPQAAHGRDPARIPANDNHPSLAKRTIEAARRQFRSYGHDPSPGHWRGLEEIAANIEAQANGKADKKFYLSALPTGMGKTTVVIEAVKTLVSDPAYADTGVVIFLNQLKLIPDLIGRMGLQDHQFAVRTGKDNHELNALGVGMGDKKSKDRNKRLPHQNAQVLFTTQQKLTSLTPHQRNFARNPLFLYRDQPRKVRIWDEALIPIDPITLTVSELEDFARELERTDSKIATQIREWADTLPNVSDGSVTQVPCFMLDVSWDDISALDELLECDRTGQALKRMGGQEVRVYQDEYSGATTISYREVLPTEFAPLLVLDASGELRAAYEAWHEGRGNLVLLHSPGKTYRNLTIHHWDHAAGKATHRDKQKRDALVDGAVSAFFEVPSDETVLFIVRKPEKPSQDMEKLIRKEIGKRGGDEGRARFLTWGFHTATNEHKDIKNVVVVGALQTPYAHYIALLRGSGKMPVDLPTSPERVEAIRKSEIAHEVFQAVGRGAVRRSLNGDCPEGCNLWIIFSTYGRRPIPRSLLAKTFPRATVRDWDPLPPSLRGGKLKTDNRAPFVEALKATGGEWFEAGSFAPRFPKQMARRFLRDPAVLRALEAAGWKQEVAPGEKRRGGQVLRYRLVAIQAKAA